MKRQILNIFLLLAVIVTQGCQNNFFDVDSDASDAATLEIGIITRSAATRASSPDGCLGEAEYAIKSLRIFAFETDGTLDTVDYIKYSSAIVSSVVHRVEVKKAAHKDLYVIVNEPEGLFNEELKIESPEDLKNVNFTIAAAMNKGFSASASFDESDFVIPMTAIKTIPAMESSKISIGVDRAVARVDLMIDKNDGAKDKTVKITSSTVFQVAGVTLGSSLLLPEVSPTCTKDDIEPNFAVISSEVEIPLEDGKNGTAIRALSFYVAERQYDKGDADTRISIKMDRIQVDGKNIDIDNTIVLGELEGTPLSELKRNHIYKIYATYVGVDEEVVPDQFTIVDWQYEDLDGEIEGVIMAVDNTLAMDWIRNGNSFTAPIASFGSNKPIDVYLPVNLGDTDGDGMLDYEFKLYDFPSKSAGSTYDLMTLPLENNFISKIPWITAAKLVFKNDRSGYVSVTYAPKRTTYDLQSYPIRFKSDNVVKQIKVVYDNGYIPVEFLPEHLKDEAPGGIVFAKRGYAKHPREVEDIFYRDEDGYYRGEHTLTAAEAEAYCKTIGDMWYLPSKEDMKAMIMGVKELGTSYRFQDTGSPYGGAPTPALYWTKTESEATPNYYWCGNFIYNPNPVDNVFDWLEERDGTETNFVRCMLNLK